MSGESVEVAPALTEAIQRARHRGALSCCDPQIEFHSTFAAVGGAVYHGHDGLRRWYRDLEEAWRDAVRPHLEAFFDLGEHTLTFTVVHGRGMQSAVDVVLPIAAMSAGSSSASTARTSA